MWQASKRWRSLYVKPGKGTTFAYREAVRTMPAMEPLVVEDERIWINRGVYGISQTDLELSANLIRKHEARRKFARFSLSVVIPGEIYTAINNSELSVVHPTVLAERLFHGFPDSARHPVVAEVDSLRQLGAWIGMFTPYNSFESERKFISDCLSDSLGIEHEWKVMPHISLAKGALNSLSNLEEIEASLPKYIQLDRVTQ